MKVAVSVPDDVFKKAERLARSAGRSRSDVYSAAVREYVARHDPEEVTEALDETIKQVANDAARDPFVRQAARRALAATEW